VTATPTTTTRTTLAALVVAAGEGGDYDYCADLHTIDAALRDEVEVVDDTHGSAVVVQGVRLTPAEVGAVASRLRAGTVEVSPTGDVCVRAGDGWITLLDTGAD